MDNINPTNLFTSDIVNYPVETGKYGVTNYINLDNAATTPPFAVVAEGVKSYLASYGSVHRGAGTKSKISTSVYEESREVIKKFVNAPADAYVIFTGNTTGAMNNAAYFFSFLPGKVAVSSIEHSSSWLPWIKSEGIKFLGKERVFLNELEAVNKKIQTLGREHVLTYEIDSHFEFDLNNIEEILKENRIKALVLTASSNLTGYCPDIKRIGELVHKYGAYFVVDACQFIQHHKLDMQEMNIDFLAASGHKFYAPYGGGFLIAPKTFCDKFLPYQIGGGNLPYITTEGEFLRYENQLAHDPGTPNAIGAVSMSLALKKLTELGVDAVEKYEMSLARSAYYKLRQNPYVEVYVSEDHLSTVIPFNIINKDARQVAEELNNKFGIGVRAGSFCVYQVVRKLLKTKNEEEIVQLVKDGDQTKIPAIIRASFGLCNTTADVERFVAAIDEITSNKQ